MKRVINFGAGPAALPACILKRVKEELLNWNNTGVSIVEISHRSKEFIDLGEKIEFGIRKLLSVPDDFAILFLPGGGQTQFAVVPMNLAKGFRHANYIQTGYWSKLSVEEGKKYLNVHLAATNEQYPHKITDTELWDIKKNAAFTHYTDNETISGLEFPSIPILDGTVLVSDMSSNILTRYINFQKIGCIYACAQKNLGIAGMSLVIVRKDLLDRALPQTPSVFNYGLQYKNRSLLCTPPSFCWYIASLIIEWLESEGGINEMSKRSMVKSDLLYNCIDSSNLYVNNINHDYRSRMNVTFRLVEKELEASFINAAKKEGLLFLEGHRSQGGVRASLYNSISENEVISLCSFMDFFEKSTKRV
ncbi:3-phosphoserine/phosphohydroxythreonine transaminase [Legionella hackeliae]|uniref:Phosphoserine aminotransferase n=1 Tax=Legionella hackeliae TaxID=449 RepID=A0A0A8US17_LEGHA|nr:3-phosphoserine/phosphohydroxythreonine transaminase [Legionella hackeliae]KTD10077.1 phosphoserine aminotransferase [Legionella hackeliae]CEK11615.1 Phosphoserine aminotransferase [Legionella hackeliae]STX48387.1 phosphoserine aminotransferase [Legionella hackeliae]